MRSTEQHQGLCLPCPPAGSDLGQFTSWQRVQGGLKETIGRRLQTVSRERDQEKKAGEGVGGTLGGGTSGQVLLPLPHLSGIHGALAPAEGAVRTSLYHHPHPLLRTRVPRADRALGLV